MTADNVPTLSYPGALNRIAKTGVALQCNAAQQINHRL